METDIDNILEENEKNLYQIQKTKIQQLEKSLFNKTQALLDLSKKYKDLEDDFNHNMLAIQQRDQDLEETTEKLLQFKAILDNAKEQQKTIQEQGEISRMKLQNELENVSERFESNRQEQRYQKKRYEDQIKDLKYILLQKEEQLEQIIEENKLSQQIHLNDTELNYIKSTKDMSNQIEDLEKQLTEQIKTKNELEKQKNQELFDLNSQFQIALHESLKGKNLISETTSSFKHEITTLRTKLQTQQITLDQLKIENLNIAEIKQAIEVKMNDKITVLTEERDLLFIKLQQTSLDKKQKLNYTKENCDRRLQEAVRECDEKMKKNEYEKQLVVIDYEKLCVQERHLQGRILELEGRLRRELVDQDQRLQLYQRNQEQNRRSLQNEIEMKEFQFKQVKDENERQQAQIKEMNQVIDQLQIRVQEISSENKILIDEVVKYRKMDLQNHNTISQENLYENKTDRRPKSQARQQSPMLKPKFLIQEDEVESFDQIFSDDQGPAPQFMASQRFSQYKSRLVASHSKVRELDTQINQLKTIIEDITQDYDRAKNKLILNNQEISILKNENLELQKNNYTILTEKTQLESQLMKVQNEVRKPEGVNSRLHSLQQILNEKEVQIELLNKKINQFRDVIQDLRAEREKLLEITNDLNQKVRDEEEDSEQYKQQLLRLQSDVEFLNKELQVIQLEKSNNLMVQPLKEKQIQQKTKTFVELQKEQIKQIKDRYTKPQQDGANQGGEQLLSLSKITETILQNKI